MHEADIELQTTAHSTRIPKSEMLPPLLPHVRRKELSMKYRFSWVLFVRFQKSVFFELRLFQQSILLRDEVCTVLGQAQLH